MILSISRQYSNHAHLVLYSAFSDLRAYIKAIPGLLSVVLYSIMNWDRLRFSEVPRVTPEPFICMYCHDMCEVHGAIDLKQFYLCGDSNQELRCKNQIPYSLGEIDRQIVSSKDSILIQTLHCILWLSCILQELVKLSVNKTRGLSPALWEASSSLSCILPKLLPVKMLSIRFGLLIGDVSN